MPRDSTSSPTTKVGNRPPARSLGDNSTNHMRNGSAPATAKNDVRNHTGSRPASAIPPSTNAGRKTMIPCGAATIGKASRADNRHHERRPDARAPPTSPIPSPPTAANVMINNVPDQLNSGSFEISRIQARAATPQPAPRTRPAAACRHITTRPAGKRAWPRPHRCVHWSRPDGSRSTGCPPVVRTGPTSLPWRCLTW